MNLVALAAAGAVVAVLAIVLGWTALRLRGARRAGNERVAAAVGELSERMEAMVLELQGVLERAREESTRNRVLGELAGSIELDDVVERTLTAAGTVTGADAAVLSLDPAAGLPVTATVGLEAADAEPTLVAGPPDGREVRAVELVYRYDGEQDPDAIHGGLAVPVRCEAGRLGVLAVYTRSAGGRFADGSTDELEELARRAGPALENARRFGEARRLADLDALTGLHNRRSFHETLAREVARAQRYGRQLALIVFDVDDFKAVNDRIGHLAGDAVLAEVAVRVRAVLRSADLACRIGGDEFAVVMPESSVHDAQQLAHRLQASVSARPIVDAGFLAVSAGVAGVRPDDDAGAFFGRADDALYRAKETGKGGAAAEAR